MNAKILRILEFEKIKDLFVPFLSTAQGRLELTKLTPISDTQKIRTWFQELDEFAAVTVENDELRLGKTIDLTEILKRLELEAVLSGRELVAIQQVISSTIRISQYFDQAVNVTFPVLSKLVDKLRDLTWINTRLSIFDSSGILLDDASPGLASIRRSIRQDEGKIKKMMQDFLIKKRSDLAENLVTIRNDRQVLPVKADAKGKFPGVVHDISSSGQTYYIEPTTVVSLNNSLGQKRLEEKNEIARILSDLTDDLRPYTAEIRQNTWVLGQMDLIRAKASFLSDMKATIPEISNHQNIILKAARHPLIDAGKVVANDIILEDKINTIVITGPNTGGKTITLKTVGLLTVMAQAGLPILAEAGSKISIFHDIFADIGDEQSIEQSLSTFSSHMTNIIEILSKANHTSLVLLDELGAGTDPKEGAALAISILEKLRKGRVKTLATTHYPELKVYGLETDQVMNASMIFDLDHFRPTYKLNLGIPGASNALEISKRLGLAADILDQANGLLSDQEHDISHTIARLERLTQETVDRRDEARGLEIQNRKIKEDLDRQLESLARDKAQLEAVARREAEDIVVKARHQAQTILKKIQEGMVLKPHEVIGAMAELDQLVPDLSQNKVLKKAKAQRGLKAGVEVLVTSFGQRGRLVKLEKDGKWSIAMGTMTVKLPESDFEVLVSAMPPAKTKGIKRKVTSNVKSQLDLRGTRYEEAALEIDNYIDQALLANLSQITIVHGIGTGVIRNLVQEKLARNKQVKSFTYAPMNAGGSGATIALLK